jgi:hypothetical protein
VPHPIVIGTLGHGDVDLEHDVCEPGRTFLPIDGSCRLYRQRVEVGVRGAGNGAEREQEAAFDGCQQQMLRAPRIARPVEIGGLRYPKWR